MSGIREEKAALRKKFRVLRDGLSVREVTEYSDKIWYSFLNSELYLNAKMIGAYINTGSEVQTMPYLNRVLKDGKRLAVPRCGAEVGQMDMYVITSLDMLKEGAYGIMEPDPKLCNDKTDEWGKGDILLVPALAYDKDGFRLGYGGGYYDRFLRSREVCTAGLAFSCCICEKLPRETTDKKVDYLITECGCDLL